MDGNGGGGGTPASPGDDTRPRLPGRSQAMTIAVSAFTRSRAMSVR